MSQDSIEKYFGPRAKESKRRRAPNSPEMTSKISRSDNLSEMEASSGSIQPAWLHDMMGMIKSLNEKMAKVATKDDLNNIDNKIEKALSGYNELKKDLKVLKQENREMREKIEELENRTRKNNLIFRGLSDHSDYEKVIRDVCRNVLNVTQDINILQAFKIGNLKDDKKIVFVELASYRDIAAILSKLSNLKNTGIYINRDFGFLTRRRRTKLLLLRKEIKRSLPEMKIHLREDKLIVTNVNGRSVKLKWSEDSGLLTTDDMNGFAELKVITSCDFTYVFKSDDNIRTSVADERTIQGGFQRLSL